MWTSRVVGIESRHQAAWLIELTHQYFFPVSCFHAVVPPGQRTKTEPFVDSALTVCFDCSWKMTCRRRCESGRSTSQWPRPLASIVKRRSNVALWALAPSVLTHPRTSHQNTSFLPSPLMPRHWGQLAASERRNRRLDQSTLNKHACRAWGKKHVVRRKTDLAVTPQMVTTTQNSPSLGCF